MEPGFQNPFSEITLNTSCSGDSKSVVLDNNIQDLSQVKERITMKLMREFGLPAPRESSARLMINGQFVGVYTVVEPVDNAFRKIAFRREQRHVVRVEPNRSLVL